MRRWSVVGQAVAAVMAMPAWLANKALRTSRSCAEVILRPMLAFNCTHCHMEKVWAGPVRCACLGWFLVMVCTRLGLPDMYSARWYACCKHSQVLKLIIISPSNTMVLGRTPFCMHQRKTSPNSQRTEKQTSDLPQAAPGFTGGARPGLLEPPRGRTGPRTGLGRRTPSHSPSKICMQTHTNSFSHAGTGWADPK